MSPIESTIFMSKLIKEKEEEREAEEKNNSNNKNEFIGKRNNLLFKIFEVLEISVEINGEKF